MGQNLETGPSPGILPYLLTRQRFSLDGNSVDLFFMQTEPARQVVLTPQEGTNHATS